MILAVVKHEAVWVVRPAALRRKLELRAQRLAVEIAGIFQRIALLDLRERLRVVAQFVHADRDAFPHPRAHIERCPPVGLRVGELDVEEALDLAVHKHLHIAFRCAGLHGKMEQPFRDGDLALRIGEHARRAAVALHDVVGVDVPPAAFALIHDFDARRFSAQIADIPRRRLQILAAAGLRVRARDRAHSHAVHEQVHAGLARVAAAADEKIDERPLDLEFRRREPPDCVVAAVERVHQTLAEKPLDLHLPRQRSVRGNAAKRCALGLPRAVVRAFKIREQDVVGGVRGAEAREGEEKCGCELIHGWRLVSEIWNRSGSAGVGPVCEQTKAATSLAR